MTSLVKYPLSILVLSGLFSCDDLIHPSLDQSPKILVIDAWINDVIQNQTIRVSKSTSYFDGAAIDGVSGAEVYIIENDSARYDFIDNNNGDYTWYDSAFVGFGVIDNTYELNVNLEGKRYSAVTKKYRVPEIDSITFAVKKAELNFLEGYWAQFWATDIEGRGDSYWIKTYKNDVLLSKPSEINIAFDASTNQGFGLDHFIFPRSVRLGVNPEDINPENENQFLAPYAIGDIISVEIHSVSSEAFQYLRELKIQTDRSGGFTELFGAPLSNLSTNITLHDAISSEDDDSVLGFFTVSAVERLKKKLELAPQ